MVDNRTEEIRRLIDKGMELELKHILIMLETEIALAEGGSYEEGLKYALAVIRELNAK